MAISEPTDTLIRLVRGTPHAPLPGQVDKVRALAAISKIGAAAYAEARSRAELMSKSAGRPTTTTTKPLSEDRNAAVFRFHAADATLMIRAMIAAASADGEIDTVEDKRILGYLRDSNASPAEIQFARQQVKHVSTIEDLARRITSRETAVEVYAAALLTADGGNYETRLFLGRLASALKLDPEFVTKLHSQWGDPPPIL